MFYEGRDLGRDTSPLNPGISEEFTCFWSRSHWKTPRYLSV